MKFHRLVKVYYFKIVNVHRHQKNKIDVFPETYLDLIDNLFNTFQLKQLSLGPFYIRLNQSAIRPKKQQIIEIKKEHKDIYKKVELNLIRNQGIPMTAPIFKQYSRNLLNYFHHCYFVPLSYKDQIQWVIR